MSIDLKVREYLTQWQKVMQGAKLTGHVRNKKWLFKLAKAGRLVDRHGYVITNITGYLSKVFKVIKILEDKYGENWDIHFTSYGGGDIFHLNFILYYKEFTITNYDNGLNRQIKDMYVVLPFKYDPDNNNAYFSELHGTRGRLSVEEIKCRYRHSHLPSRDSKISYNTLLTTNTFCIGATGDLPYLLNELTVQWDTDQMEYLFYLIDTNLMCESAVGGPHIRMGSLSRGDSTSVDKVSMSDYYDFFARRVGRTEEKLPLNFYIGEGRFKVKVDNTLNDYIKDWFLSMDERKAEQILCRRTADGYINYSSAMAFIASNKEIINIKDDDGNYPMLIFRGTYRPMKIDKDRQVTETPDISTYQVYPKFLEYVSTRLEREIYEAAIKSSAFREYQDKSSDVQGVHGQSEISL